MIPLRDVKQGQLFQLWEDSVGDYRGPVFLKLPVTDDFPHDAAKMVITVDDLLKNRRTFNYHSLETDTKVVVRDDLTLSVIDKK